MKSSWTRTTLGDLVREGSADYQTGPFGTMLKASEYSDEGSPLISVGEIREGDFTIYDHTPRVCDKIKAKLPQFVLEEGDIVFGRKGAINRNAIVMKSQAGWFLGSDGIRLRLTEKHNPAFFSYFLRTTMIGQWLLSNGQGAIMPSLNQKILDRLPLFLPSKAEQKRISAVLTALDAKIELNQRINAELEGMAKLLYDYWFVQFDFPMTAAQAAALGKPKLAGHPYRASGGKMIYNETLKRDIPEGWSAITLSKFANITMGQSPPGDSYNQEGAGTVFFQGSTDFGWRYPQVREFTTAPSRLAKAGDILLSVRAPVGTLNIADQDCCIGRGLSALNAKSGHDSFLFEVMLYFKTIFDRRNTSGTTFGSITKDDLHSLEFACPPTGSPLLDGFEEKIKPAHHTILNNHQQNQELTQLRDWLLPMLMNGQVTVG